MTDNNKLNMAGQFEDTGIKQARNIHSKRRRRKRRRRSTDAVLYKTFQVYRFKCATFHLYRNKYRN